MCGTHQNEAALVRFLGCPTTLYIIKALSLDEINLLNLSPGPSMLRIETVIIDTQDEFLPQQRFTCAYTVLFSWTVLFVIGIN